MAERLYPDSQGPAQNKLNRTKMSYQVRLLQAKDNQAKVKKKKMEAKAEAVSRKLPPPSVPVASASMGASLSAKAEVSPDTKKNFGPRISEAAKLERLRATRAAQEKGKSSDFGPRVSEADKFQRLRATRAALSKSAPTVVPTSAQPPKPKAKPAVVKMSATGKGVVKKTPSGKWVSAAPAKKPKNAMQRRMAERYAIGSDGKSL